LQRQMAGQSDNDDTRPGNRLDDGGTSGHVDDGDDAPPAAVTPVTEHSVPPAVLSPSSVESAVSVETIRPARNCPSAY